jgi:hypothetical protein
VKKLTTEIKKYIFSIGFAGKILILSKDNFFFNSYVFLLIFRTITNIPIDILCIEKQAVLLDSIAKYLNIRRQDVFKNQ